MSGEESYAAIFASAKLPTPSPLALELIELTRRPQVVMQDVARVVATDPAICARVMQTANAASRGARRHVSSIDLAVTMLGLRAIARIAVEVTVLEKNRAGVPLFDYGGFWAEALARAVAARLLAARTGLWGADEAFTYGLLGSVGRLALVSVYPSRYQEMLRTLGRCDIAELAEAEHAMFGIDTERLTAEMLEQWGLDGLHAGPKEGAGRDPEVAESDRGLVLICRAAHRLARLMVYPGIGRSHIVSAMHALADLGIGAEAAACMFPDVADGIVEIGPSMRISTPEVPTLAEVYARAPDGT